MQLLHNSANPSCRAPLAPKAVVPKIARAHVLRESVVHLEFSDGSQGDYDLGELIERGTVMVRSLRDPDFFSKCFLELGALC